MQFQEVDNLEVEIYHFLKPTLKLHLQLWSQRYVRENHKENIYNQFRNGVGLNCIIQSANGQRNLITKKNSTYWRVRN
jgi:hypothetical protein